MANPWILFALDSNPVFQSGSLLPRPTLSSGRAWALGFPLGNRSPSAWTSARRRTRRARGTTSSFDLSLGRKEIPFRLDASLPARLEINVILPLAWLKKDLVTGNTSQGRAVLARQEEERKAKLAAEREEQEREDEARGVNL